MKRDIKLIYSNEGTFEDIEDDLNKDVSKLVGAPRTTEQVRNASTKWLRTHSTSPRERGYAPGSQSASESANENEDEDFLELMRE